ncbi:uncharacterized protein LOC116316062 [Oreochromis aureus]|uniref:uncharacterized protein LOC116316062 n=1 Tax=Oreochromis aureus TaxID=47969 RepID=UPI001952DBA2|nr:uncharacterized protein LOC116316062 [Oreochromis aureus]CAI5655756.1 unnamed protein product [Mustela putorius furo]
MRFFLLSAFFVVSAGEGITVAVKGFEKDDVLLPCNCSNRDLNKDFKWQVEDDEERGVKGKLIFRYNDGTLDFKDNPSHRYETFFHNDSSNCSVLLKNITKEDQGKYSCRFYSPLYRRFFFDLTLCGTNISQHRETHPNGGNIYQCVVKLDCYKEPNIQWTWNNGTCLSNSATTNISTTYSLDKETGVHYFHSRLETKDSLPSEPKCELSPLCEPEGEPEGIISPLDTKPNLYFRIFCTGVPVVLVLGFLLIWCRRGTSHRFYSEEDV